MQYVRLIDAKPVCKIPLNLCETDDRLVSYINRACERLLYKMKAKGTWVKYRICASDGCLIWPRQLETIEVAAVCDWPVRVRNEFFEFLEAGFGLIKTDSCGLKLVDQGEVCSFDNITGDDKKLAIYADVTETTDEPVIVQYYDENGQWVRTQDGDGNWIDGEELTIPAAGNYTYTSLKVMPNGLIRVIKPKTNGTIRLYEYDTISTDLKPLGYYEPSETVPVYRRSLIPSLSAAACCGAQDGCEDKAVEVIGKLRFIPAEVDNDFLPIQNVEAIRLACQAIAKEEKDLLGEAVPYWAMAEETLKEQLEHYVGNGQVQPIRVIGIGHGGGVPVLV